MLGNLFESETGQTDRRLRSHGLRGALALIASGKAEIDYTDCSLTRLGSSTEFTITKLTNARGGRQTEGTLTVGETWNRASKVSETSSFQVKAGGKGAGDLPAPPTTTTAPPPTTQPPGGGGGGGAAAAAASPTVIQQDVQPSGSQYQLSGGIIVDNPTIGVGGTETFRGSGCGPNEVLTVLFDGKPIGTITAHAQGDFAGAITIPKGTAPGAHTLTVRGSSCELNATITVSALAFTGSSSNTSTYVLLGFAAMVVGLVFIVGARRRRTGRMAGSVRGSP